MLAVTAQGLVVEHNRDRVAARPAMTGLVGLRQIGGAAVLSDDHAFPSTSRNAPMSPHWNPNVTEKLHTSTIKVARLRGGAGVALGMGPVISRLLMSVLPVLLSLAYTAADEHGPGHQAHDHGHSHASHGESHGHSHSPSHSHGHSSVDAITQSSALWNYISALTIKHPATSAITACGFVSCSALFVMPFLPILKNGGETVSVHNSVLLKVLISFAVGGLLGDVFLHMLPHMISRTFASKRHEDEVSQALAFGCPILGGMLIFYLAEKVMAAISQDSSGHCSEHGHTHGGHGYAATATTQGHGSTKVEGCKKDCVCPVGSHGGNILDLPPERTISGFRQHVSHFEHSSIGDLCRRCHAMLGLSTGLLPDHWIKSWQTSSSQIKPAAYLNFLADLLHNFSDGLALGVSFGKGHGLSTTMAVFFHEVPHNVADFAILISNGFSGVGALQAQWASAVGALLGTIAGLKLQNINGMQGFIAGGFVYVATVDIIPLMLQDTSISTIFVETLAMMLGVALNGCMLYLEHSVPGACAH